MSDSYEKIKENEEAEFTLERAKICLEYQSLFARFVKRPPAWLHVLRPAAYVEADSFGGWRGMSGKIDMVERQILSLDERSSRAERDVDSIKTKLDVVLAMLTEISMEAKGLDTVGLGVGVGVGGGRPGTSARARSALGGRQGSGRPGTRG